MFDIIVKTQRVQLFCVNVQSTEEYRTAVMDTSKDAAHGLLGHSNAKTTMKSDHYLGWKLMGVMYLCNSCQVSKAKQKAVPKISEHAQSNTLVT